MEPRNWIARRVRSRLLQTTTGSRFYVYEIGPTPSPRSTELTAGTKAKPRCRGFQGPGTKPDLLSTLRPWKATAATAAHGDVIDWVRDIEGVDPATAISILDSRRPINAVFATGVLACACWTTRRPRTA